jgi:hypothetical protein
MHSIMGLLQLPPLLLLLLLPLLPLLLLRTWWNGWKASGTRALLKS